MCNELHNVTIIWMWKKINQSRTYMYRGYSNVWSEYDFYFIESSEKMNISWVPNMTFISSSEVKKIYFMSAEGTNEIYIFSLHEIWLLFHWVKWKNIYFMSAEDTNEIHIFFNWLDEIKVIFTTNIWIFFLLYTSLSIEKMQILHLQGEVRHAVLSLGGDI